ncbi:MAG: type II toxin-antitoxin system ParD family antitoxin [Burkholderiaceae bacterium]
MPASYSIGEHFERFVQDQLRSGRYGSASEVVRDGLRLLEEREQLRQIRMEKLRAALQAGIDSEAGRPVDEVLDELEARYAKMMQGFDAPV